MKKTFVRLLVIIPVIAIQALWLVLLIKWLSPYSAVINFILSIFAAFFVLYIITKRDESTYKILWLLIILTMPLAGAALYLLFGNRRSARILQGLLKRAELPPVTGGPEVLKELEDSDPRMSQTMGWLQKKTGCPLLKNESVKYYRLGDELFPDMLNDLRSAEEYIFVEYFIIANGVMWNAMVDIMSEKARQGVDVRVMYDDLGSISTFNANDVRQLTERGIKCVTFNPFVVLSGNLNYRDHRKMLIVDGRVAYSGGINIADEYINQKERFGHWKDIGFRVTGTPAAGYARMFAGFWNAFSKQPVPDGYTFIDPSIPEKTDGYVLSYCDSPFNADSTSTKLFIDLLSQATEYAWFCTPYLMPGDDLVDAMIMAAQRGVDVRIMMPGIPDKKLIFRMSHSFYQELLMGGVKIYEYIPGFLHAKSCVIDGKIATVGSVNLDHRSLFLQFENNSLFYRSSVAEEVMADFLATLERCREIVPYNQTQYALRLAFDGILRIFAPLC